MEIVFIVIISFVIGLAWVLSASGKQAIAAEEKYQRLLERVKSGEKIYTVGYLNMYPDEKRLYDSGLVTLTPCSNGYEYYFEYLPTKEN